MSDPEDDYVARSPFRYNPLHDIDVWVGVWIITCNGVRSRNDFARHYFPQTIRNSAPGCDPVSSGGFLGCWNHVGRIQLLEYQKAKTTPKINQCFEKAIPTSSEIRPSLHYLDHLLVILLLNQHREQDDTAKSPEVLDLPPPDP